jgi:hypothetical protein
MFINATTTVLNQMQMMKQLMAPTKFKINNTIRFFSQDVNLRHHICDQKHVLSCILV